MRLLMGLVASLALLGACGGGGGGGGAAGPTVTAVNPAQGSTAGGTPVTITGTNFAAGATVTFAGVPATSVVVVDAMTITCVTPAGTGSADVACTVGGTTATLPSAYMYFPPPTIFSVNPPMASNFGSTPITIGGSGFVANNAGTNTVTIGGVAANSVVVVNDSTITCVTSAGPAGAHPVQVTNANGSVTGAFGLFEPILVSDGGGNPLPPSWDLWAVDPLTGNAHPVGPIGFGVTCMDFDPATGMLYGATAPGGPGGPPGAIRQLISINPVTGAGTLIGNLDDAGGFNFVVQGMSFVGNTLYAAAVQGGIGHLITINTTTGQVTPVGPNPFSTPGGGFATDAANTGTYYMGFDVAGFFSVNVTTSVFTGIANLTGFALANGRLKSATFHQGALYALDADGSVPGGPSPRHLVTINPATAVISPGPLAPSPFASGVASRTR